MEKHLKGRHIVVWGVFCHLLLGASPEKQKEAERKTDRSGLGWWDQDPSWLSVGPLVPPIGPPSPQRQVAGPPLAPLDQGRPPAPLAQPPTQGEHVTRSGVHAEDIRCMKSGGVTLLSAVVVPPPDFSSSRPVFEDASATSADCLMRPHGDELRRTFQMHVQHFSRCGVRVQHASDGKEWISVTLRFPVVEGLRSAGDEYVVVMCKPQERTAATHHSVDMRGTAALEGRSVQPKKVFRSEFREVSCRVSLMARGGDSRGGVFSREMKSGAAVIVGQELQIRAAVREGDGWNYAMLKDVTVSRVPDSHPSRTPLRHPSSIDIGESAAVYREEDSPAHDNIAHLVLGDGCRNPVYRPVALFHPQRDPQRPLSVSFTFRAFMFQDMADGESLRLSAQVLACAEQADCEQSLCDVPRGVGKKRRRRGAEQQQRHQVANFSDDFELVVALGGFATTPLLSPDIEVLLGSKVDCKLLVICVGTVAVFVCVVATTATSIVIGGRRRPKTLSGDVLHMKHVTEKKR